MEKINDQWQEVLKLVEKEMNSISYDLWVKSLEVLKVVDGVLLLAANTALAKAQVKKNHFAVIKLCIAEVFGDSVKEFEVLDPEERSQIESKLAEDEKRVEVIGERPSSFMPKYTFDNFIVGDSNNFVFAASKGVAENPGTKINPLFIYGGVGLGKTHLLNAIGNEIRKNKPELNALYITCEKFTIDYINSLKKKNNENSVQLFREKYRNLDVLIIDDIQSISNKKETQEEFFHTFNELYQSKKQIIIASDRHPSEIATLSERMKSRFASGLVQDIQMPDYETRVAILEKKAEEEGYNLDRDVVEYLAENIDSNVREMEGVLIKVALYASLNGKHFATLEDAKIALKDKMDNERSEINIDKIFNAVIQYYNVSKEELIGKKRTKEIAEARMICVYLITEMLTMPLMAIGSYFGGRDHTTIMHSRDKISNQLKIDLKLKTQIKDLKALVNESA